jgi:Uma2 family endonuclease
MAARLCDPGAEGFRRWNLGARGTRVDATREAFGWAEASVSSGDLIRVATPTSQRYSDLYIVCGVIDATATVVTIPSVIIEVVSRESVERDLSEKRAEYLAIPGLEVYVTFVEEERRCLEFIPGREPVEQREHVTIHGVTIDLSELFAGLPEP